MSTTKKPTLTTTIPPINPEPVELDGTPTSPNAPRFGAGHRFPRATTLDSATPTPTPTTTTTANLNPGSNGNDPGAAAIVEANIEGAMVGDGVDEAALRMNGQAVGNREGEEEVPGEEEEDSAEMREVS